MAISSQSLTTMRPLMMDCRETLPYSTRPRWPLARWPISRSSCGQVTQVLLISRCCRIQFNGAIEFTQTNTRSFSFHPPAEQIGASRKSIIPFDCALTWEYRIWWNRSNERTSEKTSRPRKSTPLSRVQLTDSMCNYRLDSQQEELEEWDGVQ